MSNEMVLALNARIQQARMACVISLVLLCRMGVVSLEQLRLARPYVIVGAFVVAAIVTPPDVISQIMLAVPLVVLYEAGVQVCRFVRPKSTEWAEVVDEQ